MVSKSMAGAATIGLLVVYCYIAFNIVVIVPVLLSTLIEGGWSIAVTIIAFLIAASVAVHGYGRLARWRHIADTSAMFAGYKGERVPIYSLLSVTDERGTAAGEQDHQYSLGVADEEVFLMRHRRREPETQAGGKLVMRRGRPVTFSNRALAATEVIERDDAAIAAGAVDTRDYGERLGSTIGQALTGTRIKTRIVPFAAYLVLREQRGDGWTELVAAIPTEVDSISLAALGSTTQGNVDETGLVGHAVDLGSGPANAAAAAAGREIVGDSVANLAGGASDLIGGVTTLINPDAAEIATTRGSRGRLMARLIANRLRAAAA